MEDLRSKSDNRSSQLDLYQYGPAAGGMQDLRCYSASYATAAASSVYPSQNSRQLEMSSSSSSSKEDPNKLKKGKSIKGWTLSDPELQRKKRVASYKAYTVEGKVKGSFKKSFRWLKDRYSRVVYGWW